MSYPKSMPPLPGTAEPERPWLIELILPYKLNRLGFFWRSALWHIILFTTLAELLPDQWAVAESTGLSPEHANLASITLWVVTFLALTTYGVLYIYTPRMRDCGHNPWLLGLLLVPYVSILVAVPLACQPSKTWQPGQKASKAPRRF